MDIERKFRAANEAVKRRRPVRKEMGRIDTAFARFIRKTAAPARRCELVPQAFEQVIGPTLAAGCRVEQVKSGRLNVSVLSGAYMFQLSGLAEKIVEQLARQCPQAHIREVKFRLLRQPSSIEKKGQQ